MAGATVLVIDCDTARLQYLESVLGFIDHAVVSVRDCATWRESVPISGWPLLAVSVFKPGVDGARSVHAHLSLARGVLRVSVALLEGDDPSRAGAAWRTTMRCIRERPATDAADSDQTSAFRSVGAESLVRRVREAFDPAGVLNPGILP